MGTYFPVGTRTVRWARLCYAKHSRRRLLSTFTVGNIEISILLLLLKMIDDSFPLLCNKEDFPAHGDALQDRGPWIENGPSEQEAHWRRYKSRMHLHLVVSQP